MDIIKETVDKTLNITLKGWLDTNSAPELEAELINELDGVEELVFDFSQVDYISSAGLRVILLFFKMMQAQKGTMKIKHPKDEVIEVFDMTGFSSFLTIEE